jgi:hypothetical protein
MPGAHPLDRVTEPETLRRIVGVVVVHTDLEPVPLAGQAAALRQLGRGTSLRAGSD